MTTRIDPDLVDFGGGPITGYSMKKLSDASLTGAKTIDLGLGNFYYTPSVTGNVTFGFSNWPTNDLGKVDIMLKSDATGGHTVTVTGATWATTQPAIMTASKYLHIVVLSPDGGATKIAYLVAEGF